jgi:hypothetical protein
MDVRADMLERPDVSDEESRSNELIKRIWKLRWMGMDDAANRIVRVQIDRLPKRAFLGCPLDTD